MRYTGCTLEKDSSNRLKPMHTTVDESRGYHYNLKNRWHHYSVIRGLEEALEFSIACPSEAVINLVLTKGHSHCVLLHPAVMVRLAHVPPCVFVYYYIPVKGNTALLSSHRGCGKDIIRPTLILRPSTKLSLLLFRQF